MNHGQIILLSTLLMITYSWDEFMFSIRFFVKKQLFKNNAVLNKPRKFPGDQLVSMVLFSVAIPILSYSYLSTMPQRFTSLLFLSGYLLLAALISFITSVLLRYQYLRSKVRQSEAAAAVVFSVAGMFHPLGAMFDAPRSLPRGQIAKVFSKMCIPFIIGTVVMALFLEVLPEPELVIRLNVLTMVLVGGLLIQATISFLETTLYKIEKIHLNVYLRIFLGLTVICCLVFL